MSTSNTVCKAMDAPRVYVRVGVGRYIRSSRDRKNLVRE